MEARGARFTLLVGYVFCLLGFVTMLLLWKEGIPYWKVGLGYALIGIGVGFAGTPASHSLTGSVPVRARRHGVGHRGPAARPRRRDHAVDPRGAAHRRLCGRRGCGDRRVQPARHRQRPGELTKSFAGAEAIAEQHPQYASQITAAAKTAFLQGDQWAYTAGIVAILLGAALVFFLFPKREDEERLLAEYHAEDAA